MSAISRVLVPAFRNLFLGFCALISVQVQADAGDRVIAFTGYLPPLSINEDKKGIAVELMELVAEKAGLEFDFRFAPWKRAQLLAEHTPGSVLFTLGYSPARAERFLYIAPLIYTESAFVTLDQPLDTFEKAIAMEKVVGVHLGSLRSAILKESGLKNLAEISSAEQMTAMLRTGRIDAWYTMSMRASYMFRQMGYDPDSLVIGAPLTHGVQWLAANKTIDPDMRARLSLAVSKVRRDPRFWKIVDRYTS